MPKFRDLRADEVEVRVSTVSDKGCSLLLYKDARCDMAILDETVGEENWQRSHELINENLFCNVSIRCGDVWVTKQDVGTESYTEKEKGQASDSFKRACFNWGIGRELYTAPFIWIPADKCNLKKGNNGKLTTFERFDVSEMEVENKRITKLTVINARTGDVVYRWAKSNNKPKATTKPTGNTKAPEKAPTSPANASTNGLTDESRAKLNNAVMAYVSLTGRDINDVMKKLQNALGKPFKTVTEQDVQTVLRIFNDWQKEYVNSNGMVE